MKSAPAKVGAANPRSRASQKSASDPPTTAGGEDPKSLMTSSASFSGFVNREVPL